MVNKIVIINFILILNLSFKFYPMKKGSISNLKNIIEDKIRSNSIFDPLNGIKKIIKEYENQKNENYANIFRNRFLTVAESFARKYFAQDELLFTQEERNYDLKHILMCEKDSLEFQIKAAKLIIAGISKNLIIRYNTFNLSPLLFIAYSEKFMNLIKLLIKNGININYQDDNGKTLFNWALLKNKQEIINLLLKKNLDISLQDSDALELLINLINYNKKNSIKKLLKLINLDIATIKDKSGKTALNYAYETKNKEIFIELLEYSGLILNVQNNKKEVNIMYLNPNLLNNVSIVNFY